MNSPTIIDLMRHGEPAGGSRYRGQVDDPLSEKGWRQMREAVGEQCAWDVIISSPLCRCAAFAEELAARHGLPLEIEPRFKEIGFGAWEGRTKEQLEAAEPGCLRRFYRDPITNVPPGAEALPVFAQRVVAAFEEMVMRHRERRVLVVGHAGMMRMVIGHVLGVPLTHTFRLQVENACISRVRVDNGMPALIFHGGRL